MTKAWIYPAAGLLLFSAGCTPGARTAPVSGVVTLDGKPLANVHVLFQPEASGGQMNVGAGSYAITDAGGGFTLRLTDSDQPGAVIGKHRVEINYKLETDDRDPRTRPPPKVLPARYNRQSELRFEVKPGGSTAANFDLKSL